MSSETSRPIVMIPGPIEFTQTVLSTFGQSSYSHTDPLLIEEFGQVIEGLRKVFMTTKGQPFVLSGSGVFTWDIVACNFLERELGHKVLLVNTGHFGDRFGDCFNQYGHSVTHVRPPVLGDVPSLESIEKALRQSNYRMVTITQVDTSTAVLTDVKAIAALVRRVSPTTLIVVDGVCSIGAEELRFDEWGIDAAITASQKAIGVPPGLAILTVSQRALDTLKARKSPVPNYYGDLTRWLPIMQAYESRTASYFGTPAVNHIRALNASLKEILKDGIEKRFLAHQAAAVMVRRELRLMGLTLVPVRDEVAANSLSAIKFPPGIDTTKLLPKIKEGGAVLAAGLHPDIKTTYFRLGHMGTQSFMHDGRDVRVALKAIAYGLKSVGYEIPAKSSL